MHFRKFVVKKCSKLQYLHKTVRSYSYPVHSTNVSIALKKTSSQGQENKIFDND